VGFYGKPKGGSGPPPLSFLFLVLVLTTATRESLGEALTQSIIASSCECFQALALTIGWFTKSAGGGVRGHLEPLGAKKWE